MDINHQLDILDRRRCRLDDRWLARRERQEREAEPFIGQLNRDGDVIYYINVMGRNGQLVGKVVEFDYHYQAVDYLVRNKYV